MLQFRIRDLLWLTGLVAICLAWQGDRRAWERQRGVLEARSLDLEKIEKLLGGESALKAFVESAKSSNVKPSPRKSVRIPTKAKDRLKSNRPTRPRNQV
jgi:hypothetical protein